MEQGNKRHELPLTFAFHMLELILAALQNSLLNLGLRPPWFYAEQLPWGRLSEGVHGSIVGNASRTFCTYWELMTI